MRKIWERPLVKENGQHPETERDKNPRGNEINLNRDFRLLASRAVRITGPVQATQLEVICCGSLKKK